jgi:hypothetical protein
VLAGGKVQIPQTDVKNHYCSRFLFKKHKNMRDSCTEISSL